MSSTAFSLGGVRFDLESGDVPQLPSTYEPFICTPHDGQPGALYHSLAPDTSIEQPAPDSDVAWDCPTWRMVQHRDGRLFIQIKTVPDESLMTVAVAAPDFSSAEILRRAGRKGAETHYALHYPSDQALVINRLAWFNACVLHSCGITHDGQVLLFCGPSGIGKTTIARRWRDAGATLLNDDRMLVRCAAGGITASATPWHGEERMIRADVLPLGGIYFLHQHPVNRIEPTGPAEALGMLMANTIAPFYLPEVLDRITSTWERVLQSVPAFHFHVTPGAEAVEMCRNHLCSTGI